MPLLFRGMKESATGQPEVGEDARSLGIRPGIDVPASDPADVVHPGQGACRSARTIR